MIGFKLQQINSLFFEYNRPVIYFNIREVIRVGDKMYCFPIFVIPAEAGIQRLYAVYKKRDSGFHQSNGHVR